MINFIVVGKNKHVVLAVLQAIRGFSDGKCVVIGSQETVSLRWSSLCQQRYQIRFDGSSDDDFISLVHTIAEQSPHVTLIPADCDAIRLTNRMHNRLVVNTTPIPDSATLEMFDDKWRFYRFCKQHQISVPATRLFNSKADLDFHAIASEFGLPFVIKPLNQAGSLGVKIVQSKKYFEDHIVEDASYDYGPVIAQRYIDGIDIDISFLADRGQVSALAIQQANGSQIGFLPNAALTDMATRLCQQSAFNGVMHIDARLEEKTGKLFLLESNPRFWASLNASVWCGLNFVAESIRQTPRVNGARQLTNGVFNQRHPLIRPASWAKLVFDSGVAGRLLRATMFDLYAVSNFIGEMPQMIWRGLSQQAIAYTRSFKKLNAPLQDRVVYQNRLTKQ